MKKIFFLIGTFFTLITGISAQSPYWSLAGNSNASNSSKLGTTKNINLNFYANNKQRMIINASNGFVGIGTTSPAEQLRISSASGIIPLKIMVNNSTRFQVHSAGGVSIGSGSTPPSNGLYVSGNVGIGTTSPLAKLHVEPTDDNGGIYAKGNNGIAVEARSFQGIGLWAYSETAYGVRAECPQGIGLRATGQTSGIEAFGKVESGVSCNSTDGVGLSASSTNSAGISASTLHGTYAAEFDGKVFASGGFTPSDKNLKQNIRGFENAMNIINKLKPQYYEYKNEAKYEFLHLPAGTHYGLMAQDLEQILPNLVSEGKHLMRTFKPLTPVNSTTAAKSLPVVAQQPNESITIKAVNYVELIPIMIKGMQEQQAQIEKLSVQNEALQKEINDLKLSKSKIANGIPVTSSGAYLKQNVPNPAKNNAIISYYLPGNTAHAQIKITDMKGSFLKVYNASGEGQLHIKNGELPAGAYNYALYINDKQIDSKQMVILQNK